MKTKEEKAWARIQNPGVGGEKPKLSPAVKSVLLSVMFLNTLLKKYRKIPKISPGAYIFLSPFLRGLFLDGLILGGAYLRREICVSKSIGPAL